MIGCGLAGAEAAYMLAENGIQVDVYDLKPHRFTPAHSNPDYAELVCSNSLKGEDCEKNACGLLKEEMRLLGSLTLEAAEQVKVPAGGALAVDREKFAALVTKKLKEHRNISFYSEEVREFDTGLITLVATGPLTSEPLAEFLRGLAGGELFFYDAAAPVVSADSIDMSCAFYADRYAEAGNGDYLNCPMTKEEYISFWKELVSARRAELKSYESDRVFEGCMPVEVMAARGEDTLRFGPLKPVGLTVPWTGRRAYATVQLRKENADATMFNMVGFQTNLAFPEQKRVFSMIPALRNAEFLRYGVMHKNIYIDSTKNLSPGGYLKKYPDVYVAGQLTGVEGYVESAASGMLAAVNIIRKLNGLEYKDFTNETVIGALQSYITAENADFQPMNANYGILAPLEDNPRDKALRRKMLAERSLEKIRLIKENLYE